MKLIDEMTGETGQGETLTRIYEHAGHLVKVDVERDFYAEQSHAAARILSAARTWTVLVTDPPSYWHKRLTVKVVADKLADRAERILSAVPAV